MNTYFIKSIWGPGGVSYPAGDGLIDFSSKRSAERFAECDGFFLYETAGNPRTGNQGGRKSIYAQGTIHSGIIGVDWNNLVQHFWNVLVDFNKIVHPSNGIPLDVIRNILGMDKHSTIQRPGGLIKITDEQFAALSLEFKNCLEK